MRADDPVLPAVTFEETVGVVLQEPFIKHGTLDGKRSDKQVSPQVVVHFSE